MTTYKQRKAVKVQAIRSDARGWKEVFGDRFTYGTSSLDGWPWRRLDGRSIPDDRWAVLFPDGTVEFLSDSAFRERFKEAKP